MAQPGRKAKGRVTTGLRRPAAAALDHPSCGRRIALILAAAEAARG
ncbi:MAG: hypothetical protein JSS35_04100 [Proteobacteria bacterium]|nr:hypothetical protein [Pseudomonadota bacterium]